MGESVSKNKPSVAESLETGALRIELIDEDGDSLPGRWDFEWVGRDPMELVIYAITELSAKPWKWSSLRPARRRLTAERSRAMSARMGKWLRKSLRKQTADVMARIIAQECLKPGSPLPDTKLIRELLAGRREPDWDMGPVETVPGMYRAFRKALRAASEDGAGIQLTWGAEDE